MSASEASWLNFAAEVDKLLRTALLLAIGSFPQAALPISISNFHCSHIIPSIPNPPTSLSSTTIDIKHSSFKSLTAFLKTAQKDGLLTIKAKGDSITKLNAGHPEVAALLQESNEAATDSDDLAEEGELNEEANRPATKQGGHVSLWKPHGQTIALFSDAGFESVLC